MPEIIVKLGDSIVQKNIFVKETIRIGRIPDNEIVVENLAVSRYHATIEYVDGRYLLTDLDSSNGSFVNGVRVKKTELQDRDVITIGKHKLYFYDPLTAAEPKPRGSFSAPDIERTMVVDPMQPPPQGKLEIIKGKQKGARFSVENNQTSIGRGSFNDIQLTDWFISKVHAVIERRGNDFVIRDLGSWRHTYVNGLQVEEMTLADNDLVQLGPSVQMTFSILREEQPLTSKARIPVELASSREPAACGERLDDEAYPSERTRKEGPLKVIAWNRDEADEARRARNAAPDEEIPGLVPEEIPEPRPLPEPAQEPAPRPEPDPAGYGEPGPAACFEPEPEPETATGTEPETESSVFPALWEMPVAQAEMELDPEPAISLDKESGGEAAADPAPAEAPIVMTGESWEPGAEEAAEPVSREAPNTAMESEEAAEPSDAAAEEAAPQITIMAPHTNGSGNANGKAAHGAPPEEPAREAGIDSADLEQEIQMWERALKNKNPIIRKQAARQLQKLTGRQYDYS